ncbi:MAG: hypothetical protein ACTSYX_03520 [Candidatus Thorarchaeota archaeon]
MTGNGRDVEARAFHLWNKVSSAFSGYLGMSIPARPRQVIVTPDLFREQAELCENTLLLSPDVAGDDNLLTIAIAREFLRACDTHGAVNPEVWNVLAPSVAREILRNRRGGHAPTRANVPSESAIGEKFLSDIQENAAISSPVGLVESILACLRLGLKIDTEDVQRIADTIAPTMFTTLTEADVALIRRLINRPAPMLRSVASDMGRSIQWVSQRILSLQDNGVIRRRTRVLLYKLSIREFKVFLTHSSTDRRESIPTLKEHPFVTDVKVLEMGPWHFLATLMVPDCSENVRAIGELVEHLVSCGHEAELFEVVASGRSESLAGFSVESQGWVIPWETRRFELLRIRRQRLADVMPRVENPLRKAGVRLGRDDLRVVQSFLNGCSTIEEIRAHLHLAQARTARSVRKLRREGIVLNQYELFGIGLPEHVTTYCFDSDDAEAIAAWSAILPIVDIRRSVEGALLAELRLPPGGMHGLCEALQLLPSAPRLTTTETLWSHDVVVPIHEWDEKNQTWTAAFQRLEEWRETIV